MVRIANSRPFAIQVAGAPLRPGDFCYLGHAISHLLSVEPPSTQHDNGRTDVSDRHYE